MTLINLVMLQAPMAADNGAMMWIMLIAMFAIMYFFMIRPQNKKQSTSLLLPQVVFMALSRKSTIMM